MTNSLGEFLTEQGYKKIKLHPTVTNHFEVNATINGVKGKFIVDTGASNSCIDFKSANTFKLTVKDSTILAAGAGATDMKTKISAKSTLKIGQWTTNKLTLVLFDLSHVNTALTNHNAAPVEGIIGADILKKGSAVIDYSKKYLYLR